MSIGVSFLDNLAGKIEQAEKEQDRYQQAVRVISMRVPRLMGGGAIAPAPLLQGQGGQGSPFANPGSAIAQAYARMGGLPQAPQQGPMGRPPMMPMPEMGPRMATPAPRIIPGIEGGMAQPQNPVDVVQRASQGIQTPLPQSPFRKRLPQSGDDFQ